MRAYPWVLVSLLAFVVPSFAAISGGERVGRDRIARERILKLNFFSEGGGMHLSPGLLDFADKNVLPSVLRKKMREDWGLNVLEDGTQIGVFRERYQGLKVGVLGCVGCHSGRAAGQFIVGLGNKNIDTGAIGAQALKASEVWKKIAGPKDDTYRAVEDSALAFTGSLADPKTANLTQGMVPTAIIRTWFYRMAGQTMPPNSPRSAVKVPSFWGYALKRTEGQFCDGLGDGRLAGWGAAVELVAHQKTEVARAYMPQMEEAEQLIGDLLPPAYPGVIAVERAARGKPLFEKTCAHCHGTYENDPQGLPVYKPPRYIPWETVRTDRDRLDGTTPEFLALIRTNPLNDFIRANPDRGQGYFAPRLHAIWARFPYLHNGSVPSVAALLLPPAQRPRYFSLRDSGEKARFDDRNLGLTLPVPGSREDRTLASEARGGDRHVYWVERAGHGNQGHEFYTDLSPAERLDLIEYLKTL